MKSLIIISFLLLLTKTPGLSQSPYELTKLVLEAEDTNPILPNVELKDVKLALKKKYSDKFSDSIIKSLVGGLTSDEIIELLKTAQESPKDIHKKSGIEYEEKGLLNYQPVSITTLVDGLAKFLAERMKEELSLAFFEKFQSKLDSNATLKALFPTTVNTTKAIGTEIYRFQSFLQSLQTSFQKDLKNLPYSLQTYSQNSDLLKQPTSKDITYDLFKLVQNITEGKNLISSLEYLSSKSAAIQRNSDPSLEHLKKYLVLLYKNVKGSFDNKTTNIYSHLKIDTITASEQTFNAFKLFTLLDWQSHYPRNLYSESVVIDGFSITNFRNITIIARDFVTQIDTIKAKRKRNEEIGFEEFHRMIDLFAQLLHANYQYISSDDPEVKKARERYVEAESEYRHRLDRQESTSDISLNTLKIELKKLNCDYLLLQAKQDSTRNKTKLFIDLSELGLNIILDVRYKKYAIAVTNTLIFLQNIIEQNPKFEKSVFLKYATFMAAIAQAEDSDDIAAVLKSFALPAGSSSIKKKTKFSVFANAYTGIAYSREQLETEDFKPGNLISAYAPVGLSVSWGLGKNKSLTFLVPLIDIGTYTAIRLNQEQTKITGTDTTSIKTGTLPELTWENIFSPGIGVQFSCGKNIPISFGYTLQLGPNERMIETTVGKETTTRMTSGLRHIVSVNVDIPIFLFSSVSNN